MDDASSGQPVEAPAPGSEETFTFRLDADLKAFIQAEAERDNRTAASWLRHLIARERMKLTA